MFLVVLLLIASADSYRILGLFPYVGKSHFKVFQPALEALALKGHDVHVVSYFPSNNNIETYHDVQLLDMNNSSEHTIRFDVDYTTRLVKYLTPVEFGEMSIEICSNLNNPDVLKLKDMQFDVVLVELFNTDCFLGLVHQLKAPFIGVASHVLMPFTNKIIGNVDNPSYIPNQFMHFSDKMSFLERLENTFVYLLSHVLHYIYVEQPDNEIIRQHFGNDMPYVGELAKNVSLILVNSHFTLNLPRPLVPGIIEISGMHIGQPKKPPMNIEKWINESKDGVIYFSMGSMIKGHTFPEHKKQAFLRAFGRLKQRVLWKWENDTMPGKPDNVMIQKWMPQFDILCHPNVKGFVSHGGLLGTTEAVHCGVPVVVMPQFGDQHTNARALEAGGGGIVLDFHNIEEDTVYRALKTILDPEFNKKAKQLSERFRDRPMPPLETAIYWIEYVARHKGADHMRTAAVNMPFYQYLLLDVIAFLILALAFTIFIVYHTIRITCGMCCKKTQKVKKS
ncbi:PREDICTED: UDP-glucuronosyltransferase 1-9-like isoform X4 [Nicrophorus vespilloides]|uniref:UDP-glucuronosyltransferase n=1 Tax=Nicrophorus vespilloides TaxID=110193 RepID=A0ABM1M346_NICVS|nr:PREDICTED: UDP-glucuronosyltransferase 1-9-like isoform X4 [Nicrophorus vespilloides]